MGPYKGLQWWGSSMPSCHLLCVSWAERVRWTLISTAELLWRESPKKPGREFCFLPFFCSNKDIPSLWDNYAYEKITGIYPSVVSCSCTIVMGPWSLQPSFFLPAHVAEIEEADMANKTGVIQIHNANSEISNWVTTHKSEALEPLNLSVQVKHGVSVCISFTAHDTQCPVWHCLVHSLRNKRTSTLLRWNRCCKEGGKNISKQLL